VTFRAVRQSGRGQGKTEAPDGVSDSLKAWLGAVRFLLSVIRRVASLKNAFTVFSTDYLTRYSFLAKGTV